MLGEDVLLAVLAGQLGAVAASWAAKVYDANASTIMDNENRIYAAGTVLFETDYLELAWDEVLLALKSKDRSLNTYLSSLGDYWKTQEDFKKNFKEKIGKCRNEEELRQLFNERWLITATFAPFDAIPILGEAAARSGARVVANQEFAQEIAASRCIKNYGLAVEAMSRLGADVDQLKGLTGSVSHVKEKFLARGRDKMQRNPEDHFSLKAQRAILEEWGQGSSVHGFVQKIVDVDRKIHNALIWSDEEDPLLRSSLLEMRVKVLEQLLTFLPGYELSLMLMPEKDEDVQEKQICLKPEKNSKKGNVCTVSYKVRLNGRVETGTIDVCNPDPLNDGNALDVFQREKKKILAAMEKKQLIPPSVGLRHGICALTEKLRGQSEELKQQDSLFSKHKLLGYQLHFVPAVVWGGVLLAALAAPWAITVATLWMAGVGCAVGLAWGFWHYHQFSVGVSVSDLLKEFKQAHGPVFGHFLRRACKGKSAALTLTESKVRNSVDALSALIQAKKARHKDCSGLEKKEKTLASILDALDVCSVYAESWRDALDVVLEGLLEYGDKDLQRDCKKHLSQLCEDACAHERKQGVPVTDDTALLNRIHALSASELGAAVDLQEGVGCSALAPDLASGSESSQHQPDSEPPPEGGLGSTVVAVEGGLPSDESQNDRLARKEGEFSAGCFAGPRGMVVNKTGEFSAACFAGSRGMVVNKTAEFASGASAQYGRARRSASELAPGCFAGIAGRLGLFGQGCRNKVVSVRRYGSKQANGDQGCSNGSEFPAYTVSSRSS
jgi:hypothetical protein